MPLPIRVRDILEQAKSLEKEKREEKRYPASAVEKTFTVVDFIPYNRVVVMESRLVYRVSDEVYERLREIMENGRLPRIRAVVDRLRIIDVLDIEEVDPEEYGPEVFAVKLSPYGSLVFEKLREDGMVVDRLYLKPHTENAQELALKLDHAGLNRVVVKCVFRPIDEMVFRSGIRVIQGGIYAWMDGLKTNVPVMVEKPRTPAGNKVDGEPPSTPLVTEGETSLRDQETGGGEPGNTGSETPQSDVPGEPPTSESSESPSEDAGGETAIVDKNVAEEDMEVFKKILDLMIEYKATGNEEKKEAAMALMSKMMEKGYTPEEIRGILEKLGGRQ